MNGQQQIVKTYLSLKSRRISRSVSRFLITSRLSNFFLLFTKPIFTLIFRPILYTEIGTAVKPAWFLCPANEFISVFVNKDVAHVAHHTFGVLFI